MQDTLPQATSAASGSIWNSMSPLFSFLGGAAIALFAEPLRQWMLRPELAFSFDDTPDCHTRTPAVVDGRPTEAVYIRARLENSASRLAKSCRVFLAGVERKAADGTFLRTLYCDGIQLQWAARGDRGFDSIDVPNGLPCFVDVLFTAPGMTSPRFKIQPEPFRYQALLNTLGTYRITLLATGDGAKPAKIQLLLEWTGVWDGFTVTIAN